MGLPVLVVGKGSTDLKFENTSNFEDKLLSPNTAGKGGLKGFKNLETCPSSRISRGL